MKRRKVLKFRPRQQPVPPGVYTVGSDAGPAFTSMLAAIAAGHVKVTAEGYRPTPHGLVKFVTAAAGVPARMPVAANPEDLVPIGGQPRRMGMSAAAFKSPFRDYSDWKMAWWREAIQNSVDAGATQVHLEVKDRGDGTWEVSCTDNGRGMSLDVIETKFLTFGESDKRGVGGQIGGFGEAKKLLILPWVMWSIWSGDVLVQGSGTDYQAYRAPAFHQGVKLTVVMPADAYTTTAPAIEVITRSFIPHVRFFVNGEPHRAALRHGELIDEVPEKIEVFYTKPPKGKSERTSNMIYVRVRGMYMFSKWIDSHPGQIIAELTGPPIELLTSNRDGFRDHSVERSMNNLATRIAKDTMSALKSKKGMIRKKFEGTGKFVAKEKEVAALGAINSAVPVQGQMDPMDVAALEAAIDSVQQAHRRIRGSSAGLSHIETVSYVPVRALVESTNLLGPTHVEAMVKQLSWEPDFFVTNDIEGFKVPKKFFPETMTPTVRKLAKVWTELCRYVLIQLGCDLPFGVGWKFDTSSLAAYQAGSDNEIWRFKADGEHWLLLNPFKDRDERKTLWRPTSNEDLKVLYALAIHEATHMADRITYHDESFAAALTMNMARCADGYRKIRRIVSSIRMSDRPEADLERF